MQKNKLKELRGHKIVPVILYNKTRHSYIYMLRIGGQTAGPIGLKFFVDTHGWPGGAIG